MGRLCNDTVDGLGAFTPECDVVGPDDAPSASSTFPVDGASTVSIGATLSVTFSEAELRRDVLLLELLVERPKAAVSGAPVSHNVNPATDFVSGESCVFTIIGANVSDADGNDPPDSMAVDFVVDFVTLDPCTAPAATTSQIRYRRHLRWPARRC